MEVLQRASKIAVRVGIPVCCLILATEVVLIRLNELRLLDNLFQHDSNYFSWNIHCIKTKHEILLTVFFFICFALMTVCYIWRLVGAIS